MKDMEEMLKNVNKDKLKVNFVDEFVKINQ